MANTTYKLNADYFWKQSKRAGYGTVQMLAYRLKVTPATIYNKLKFGWRLLEIEGLAAIFGITTKCLLNNVVDR